MRVGIFGDFGVENGVSFPYLEAAVLRGDFDMIIHVGKACFGAKIAKKFVTVSYILFWQYSSSDTRLLICQSREALFEANGPILT